MCVARTRALSQLSRDPSIQLVMETGTLNGMGSSYVIAQGLKETGGRLITIEALPDFWFQARKNLATYNVTALLGSPVSLKERGCGSGAPVVCSWQTTAVGCRMLLPSGCTMAFSSLLVFDAFV